MMDVKLINSLLSLELRLLHWKLLLADLHILLVVMCVGTYFKSAPKQQKLRLGLL